MAENLRGLPKIGVEDKIISEVKKTPSGEVARISLNTDDLKSVFTDLLTFSATIPGLTVTPKLQVGIQNMGCRLNGDVSVDHNVMGHSEVSLDVSFGNNPNQPGFILTKTKKVETNLSFPARIAIKASGINIEREVDTKLANPQTALSVLMTNVFLRNGLKLEAFGARFTDQDTFVLSFKSKNLI